MGLSPQAVRRLLTLSYLSLAGCAYIGPPLPPALNVPLPVTDLSARQRGGKIRVGFTVPESTVDELPLRLGGVDLRAGPFAADPEAWAQTAQPLAVNAGRPGRVELKLDARPWAGQRVAFGVRVASHKNRWSAWSALKTVTVAEPLPTPDGLVAEAVPEGVRLRWKPAGGREGLAYRVWRQAPGEDDAREVARVAAAEWQDSRTKYGETYRYSVQALLATEDGDVESELSPVLACAPADSFPPKVPAGLTALAGLGTVELTWDRNAESDFAAYRLYRAAAADYQILAGRLETPSYSDRAIAPGQAYRYAVSAIDQAGNESQKSEPVEIRAPQ